MLYKEFDLSEANVESSERSGICFFYCFTAKGVVNMLACYNLLLISILKNSWSTAILLMQSSDSPQRRRSPQIAICFNVLHALPLSPTSAVVI